MKRVLNTSLELSLLSRNGSTSTESFLKNYNQNKLIYMKKLSQVSLCLKAMSINFLFLVGLLLICSVSWSQNSKSTQGLPIVSKDGTPNKLSMYLYKDVDNVSTNLDVTVAIFDSSFLKDVGPEDAYKMQNGAENIFINQFGAALSIDGLPLPVLNQVILLSLNNLQIDSVYQLKVDAGMLIAPGLQPYIIDNFLNTEVIATTVVSFTPTTNVLTYQNRFSIVFRPQGALGMNFISLILHNEGNYLRVDWHTSSEINMKMYVVEKSLDGINFTKQAGFTPYNTITANYGWLDPLTPETNEYYRIKAVAMDGTFTYSNIVKYSFLKPKSPIKIYPNPAIDKITVSYNQLTEGSNLIIYNLAGNKVVSDNLVVGSSLYTLNISALAAGTYLAEVVTKNEKHTAIFIKK